MSRIDDIKARTDLVRLIEESGITLHGNTTLSGLCPFHEDRSPSLKVQRDRQWWWCYACQIGGDIFEWVKKRDGCDFSTAMQTLESGNVGIPIYRKSIEPKRPPATIIPHCVVEEFQSDLHCISPYLIANRFWSRETMEKNYIGYDKQTQRVSIPIKNPLTREWEDIRMYDVLHRTRTKVLPYIPGARKLPYILSQDRSYIMLVEGEPDALATTSLGINVATNTCGSNACYPTWKDWHGLIFTDHVYICFDNDEAGHVATQKVLEIFPRAKVVPLPSELGDITDMIRTYGPQRAKEYLYDHIPEMERSPTPSSC